MNDEEFKAFLVDELWRRSGKWLPYPPASAHDEVQYLASAGRLLCPEYVFKWPQLDWHTDVAIFEFYKDFPQEQKLYNMDRRWNIIQFLRLIAGIPGDTAECGVFEGATSLLILRHAPDFEGAPRIHHIFDSFEGCSQPGENDHQTHFYKDALSCPENAVRQKLMPWQDRVHLHKGWIPSRFSEVASRRFAFVHIDVDLYEPTRDSMEFFYPRLNDGGILVCDDYGYYTCPGATKAVDDYLADKMEKMIAFASGGGMLIKGVKTAEKS